MHEVRDFRQSLKIRPAAGSPPLAPDVAGAEPGDGSEPTTFGTFQLSVYSGLGAELLNPLTPLTTLLNYGPISEDGSVNVRIHYDHRVMDGATVARALARFEEILNGGVAEELRSLRADPAADR